MLLQTFIRDSWKAQPLVASMAHAIDQIALVCVREAGIDPGNTRASSKSFLISFNFITSSAIVYQLCPAYPTCMHACTYQTCTTHYYIVRIYIMIYWIYCIIMYGDPYDILLKDRLTCRFYTQILRSIAFPVLAMQSWKSCWRQWLATLFAASTCELSE